MPKIKYNEKELEFDNIYYVDSEIGSDSNVGTNGSPFKTVNHAVSACAKEGDAIFAKKGTHDVTRLTTGAYDSGGLWDDNKAISFFGEQGRTVFLCDGNKHTNRDTHCIMFQNAGTKAYQITFDFRVGNRTLSYSTSICGINATDPVKGEVINCAFKISSPTPNFNYSNSGSSNIKFINCAFDVSTNFSSSYSGAGFTLENCVTNFTFANEGTRKNIFNNAQFDQSYHIINADETGMNLGVFSGEFNWNVQWGLTGTFVQSNGKLYSFKYQSSMYNITMFSNTLPSPYVINSSTTYSTTYPAWKAFDNTLATSWLSVGASKEWISIDFGTKRNFDFISIQGISSAITGAYVTSANPKNMRFQGSNDNNTWSDLHIATNLSWTAEEIKSFSFKNNVKYRYLRIYIDINNGAPYIGFSEVKIGFSGNGTSIYEIPQFTKKYVDKYGVSKLLNLNNPIRNKVYVIQNKTGVTNKQLDKKPLNISFK